MVLRVVRKEGRGGIGDAPTTVAPTIAALE